MMHFTGSAKHVRSLSAQAQCDTCENVMISMFTCAGNRILRYFDCITADWYFISLRGEYLIT